MMVGGQQSTRSLPHLAELFRLADAAGLLEQPELAVRRMKTLLALHGVDAADVHARLLADHRWLSINTATVRKQRGQDWPLPRDPRRLRGARHPRHLAVARPGRAAGLDTIARQRQGARPRAVGLLPRRHVPGRRCRGAPGGARRQPARGRRSLHAGRAPAWCWWSAACPARSPARRRTGHRRRARAGRRRHRRAARRCARAPHAAGDRAAAPDVRGRPRLHQHAGAGARRLRRARPRQRSGALGVAVDVYHVWWDPKLQQQIARAGRERLLALPRLRLADADHRPAERPRHDGRRRDRHAAHARAGSRRRASPATARSRSSRQRTGGSATAARCSTPASSGTGAACSDARSRPEADVGLGRTSDRFRRRIQPVDATH